jgi:hypothetical protein
LLPAFTRRFSDTPFPALPDAVPFFHFRDADIFRRRNYFRHCRRHDIISFHYAAERHAAADTPPFRRRADAASWLFADYHFRLPPPIFAFSAPAFAISPSAAAAISMQDIDYADADAAISIGLMRHFQRRRRLMLPLMPPPCRH